MLPLEFAPVPWYRKQWGKIILAMAAFVILAGGSFLGVVGWYWWQLKQGKTIDLQNPGSSFTVSRSVVTPGDVDRAKLESGLHPLLGTGAPLITIVAFMDFKCPYSKQAAPILEQIASKYGSKVKIIFRNFPADSIHPGASLLAEISHCAFKQNRYLSVFDQLFNNQDQLTDPLPDEQLSALAAGAGLNLTRLKTCLADPNTAQEVNSDLVTGAAAGVRGTPTYFVNGSKAEGVIPTDVWAGYIENFK